MHLEKHKFNSKLYDAISDPHFYFGVNKKKPIVLGLSQTHINNYFEFSLKQKPLDFTCHIQRIKYALHVKSQDEFFAALCDLFIVLGKQGLSLRNRLLVSAGPKLSTSQAETLADYLTEKTMSPDLEFLPEQCFFKKEGINYIEVTESETADRVEQIEDIIKTAESYIENSQFETAEDYMVKHLILDPEDEPLTLKLIGLYKAMNHYDNFIESYQKFSNCLLTSRYWDEANSYFFEKNNE